MPPRSSIFARSTGPPGSTCLCTYGIVAKAVADAPHDADIAQVSSFSARFAGVVEPRETLRIRVWQDGSRLIVSATAPGRDEAPVLSDAILTTV